MASRPEAKSRAGRVAASSRAASPGAVKPGAPKSSAGPLYLQLVQALKAEILKGVYPVGTQMPTEEELCARFGVSRYTVREALRRLRDDRLVSSRQGAGTTVVRPGDSQSYVHEVTSINDLITFAVGVRYQVDSQQLVTANRALAKRLGGKEGQRWLAVRGFRYAADSELPVCWAEVFINAAYAGVGRLIARHKGPIFELIEDLYGETVGEVDQELRARPAPAELAAGLSVDDGATLIEVQRTYRLTSGTVAQVAINLHPADRFRFSMTMRRVK
jgi:GntR family transcriptional regulator